MKKIFVLGAAIRKFCGIDDWDEDWHKDVSQELDELDKDKLSGDNWIDIVSDGKKIRLRLLDPDNALLGTGAFASAILVDYNGRECVLKIINNYIDFEGNISDKSILVYEKLLSLKNNLPKGWDRYIPEIYFMGRNCKILAPENVIKLKSLRDAKKIFQNKTFDVIIMEKLNPLSKVPGLTESMDGYTKNSPDIGIITLDMINEHFNQIKEIIEDISNKSPKNIIIKFDDSEKNTSKINVGKIIFDAYIDYDIDANEFLKEHIDSKNPDLRIMEDKTSWFEERIWLNFDFKSINPDDDTINKEVNLKISLGDFLVNESAKRGIYLGKILRELEVPESLFTYVSLRILDKIEPMLETFDSFVSYYIKRNMYIRISENIKEKTRIPVYIPKYKLNDDRYINREFGELFEFLKYLYLKYGIEYDDLHHGNIMLDKNGNYKLSDVGLFYLR